MNHPTTMILKDEHGNIVFEGSIFQWTTDLDLNGEQITVKSFRAQQNPNYIPITKIISNSVTVPKSSNCKHIWVEYKGFTDNYDYCDLCGEKK